MMTPAQTQSSTLTAREAALRATYGPWAVVTGASDGIGREMAVHLARAGLNVALVARRRPLLDALAAQLRADHGVEALAIDADLSDPAGVAAALRATDALDVGLLVASAGFGTSGRFLDADLTAENNMLDVNARAVLAMTHHFAQRFTAERGAKSGRRGGIVLMSSLVAFQGVPMAAHYAATKAYVQSLAEALYLELRPLGVDVLASAPGPIYSGFAARAGMRMSMGAQPAVVAAETLAALGKRATVRPGWLSKLLIGSLSTLPRGWRVRAMARIMGGMTGHQPA
jgi:hypothetical protein